MRDPKGRGQSGTRKRRPVVYIICEGRETEKNYFSQFRTRHSLIEIKPLASKHTAAKMLVSGAGDLIRFDPYYPEDGDQIWCVFDRDSNSNEDLHEAEKIAAESGYMIAFSNPCFELWYLLHFTEQRAYLQDADAVIGKLDTDGRLKGYAKSKDYYDMLRPLQPDAVKRAQALIEKLRETGQPLLHRDSNPHTSVVSLVLYLEERKKLHRPTDE